MLVGEFVGAPLVVYLVGRIQCSFMFFDFNSHSGESPGFMIKNPSNRKTMSGFCFL